MASLLNLKEALAEALILEFKQTGSILEPTVNILTGESDINIAEAFPEMYENTPGIYFDIIEARPLTEDDPLNGCYMSKVLIYAVSHGSPKTTYMADKVTQFFTCVPAGSSKSRWFRDLSTTKILNKFTLFLNRYPLNPRQNYKTDTYTELVAVKVIWCNCNCDGQFIEDEPEQCPVDSGDTFLIEDDCC